MQLNWVKLLRKVTFSSHQCKEKKPLMVRWKWFFEKGERRVEKREMWLILKSNAIGKDDIAMPSQGHRKKLYFFLQWLLKRRTNRCSTYHIKIPSLSARMAASLANGVRKIEVISYRPTKNKERKLTTNHWHAKRVQRKDWRKKVSSSTSSSMILLHTEHPNTPNGTMCRSNSRDWLTT